MTQPLWKDKFSAAAARPEPSTADEFCGQMKTVSGKTERRRRSFGQKNRENTEKRHAGEEKKSFAWRFFVYGIGKSAQFPLFPGRERHWIPTAAAGKKGQCKFLCPETIYHRNVQLMNGF